MTRRNARQPLVYSPIALLFSLLLIALLVLAASVLFFGLVTTSFTRIGFTWRDAVAFLVASWLASHINMPLARLRSRAPTLTSGYVRAFGVIYRIPIMIESQDITVLAVNLGGGILPVLVSGYLLVRFPGAIAYALLATVAVSLVIHQVARPVRGVGIVTPALVPPLAAAIASIAFVGVLGGSAEARFVTAYVSGTVGTLIGADLLNLGAVTELGAPVVSIGGAGTFDGIFLTGILAVLLA